MERNQNNHLLSADKAKVNPEREDRLGYAPFARHLAGSISKMAPPEGLVIAIYGSWGIGKTTFLNFVSYYLKRQPQRPVIVQFNPWWFSGHEDLARRFFDQLEVVLGAHKVIKPQIRKSIAKLGDVVSETGLPYTGIFKPVCRLLGLRGKEVTELKRCIAADLRKQGKRILVIMDDIDRLTSGEMRHLFSVIKAVADFPNIVYLLAFDKEVAVKALEGMQGLPGERYLEKIVQVPFELPLPDSLALGKMLFEGLNPVVADTPDELFDKVHWTNVYNEALKHLLKTARDVVRLVNTLRVTYFAVKGEVNAVDFIAIEALRVFCPFMYDTVRKSPDWFTEVLDSSAMHPRTEDFRAFHKEWLDALKSSCKEYAAPVKELLTRIFPKLEDAFGTSHYARDIVNAWRRQRRICSSAVFPIYFRLAVPEGDISNSQMKAIMQSSSDSKAFGARLVQLANEKRPDGMTRGAAFLERMRDYLDAMPPENIPNVILAFLDVGDELLRPEDEQPGRFGPRSDSLIWFHILSLLREIKERPRRCEILSEAVLNGRAVAIIMRVLTQLGQEHGKLGGKRTVPENARTLGTGELEKLERIGLDRIKNIAKDSPAFLLSSPRLPSILDYWSEFAKEEVRDWVKTIVADDRNLIAFLEKFLTESYHMTVDDAVGKVVHTLDPKNLEPFVEPSTIIERVRRLSNESWLSERQRIASQAFIRDYEKRQAGKDPSPLALDDD